MRKFSVVIVASQGLEKKSRQHRLEECLRSLSQQAYPKDFFEIAVVDSGSGIEGRFLEDFGKSLALNLRYIDPSAGNIGPAKARNIGVKNSSFDFVAFIDDDATAPSDWLKIFDGAYDRYPESAAVGGLTLPPPQLSKINIFAYFEEKLYKNYIKGGLMVEYLSIRRDEHPVFSGNISYSKKIFLDVGLFDESFSPEIAGEDGDLKERILARGGVFVFVPSVVIHHSLYTWERFLVQQQSRGVSILRYRRHQGMENYRALNLLKLFISLFSLPALLLREKFDFRYSFVAWLSLVVRNWSKICYYGKI